MVLPASHQNTRGLRHCKEEADERIVSNIWGSLSMQRDAFKPPFAKAGKKGSLLPSVVVLPKIGGDRNDRVNHSIRSDCIDLDQLRSSGSLLERKRSSNNVIKPLRMQRKSGLEAKSLPALPQTPFKTAATEKNELKEKKEKANQNVQSRDRARSHSTISRDFMERKLSGIIPANVLLEDNNEIDDTQQAEDGFEDPNARDFWYTTRSKETGLSRRESICSSCGGAFPYSHSLGSTRRFSSVSIEVPNENFMKRSFINRGNSSFTNGDSMKSSRGSFSTGKKNDTAKSGKNRADQLSFDKAKFDRISKQRNLLYDLMSVLYKKNFVKEEIRPYVRHALEICGCETSSNS